VAMIYNFNFCIQVTLQSEQRNLLIGGQHVLRNLLIVKSIFWTNMLLRS
jgi:hypothetical protein